MGKRSHTTSNSTTSSSSQSQSTSTKTILVQTKSQSLRTRQSDTWKRSSRGAAPSGSSAASSSTNEEANEEDDNSAGAEPQQNSAESTECAAAKIAAANICAACQRPIRERYLLVALDKHWHEDCLKCACCECRLGEVGSSLFTHSDKILCRRDFLRIFGQHGNCAACKRSIPPYELVMRANDFAYHMDCFACQLCRYRFCVGDRFHLTESHRIVCVVCFGDTAPTAPHTNLPTTTTMPAPAPPESEAEPPIAPQLIGAAPAAVGHADDEADGGGGGDEPPLAQVEQQAAGGATAAAGQEQQTACAM